MRKQAKTLSLVITQATKTVWEGNATSISSSNADGPFDVLPMHANFVTLLQDASITVESKEGKQIVFDFKQAVMHVQNDVVNVYADFV